MEAIFIFINVNVAKNNLYSCMNMINNFYTYFHFFLIYFDKYSKFFLEILFDRIISNKLYFLLLIV